MIFHINDVYYGILYKVNESCRPKPQQTLNNFIVDGEKIPNLSKDVWSEKAGGTENEG